MSITGFQSQKVTLQKHKYVKFEKLKPNHVLCFCLKNDKKLFNYSQKFLILNKFCDSSTCLTAPMLYSLMLNNEEIQERND